MAKSEENNVYKFLLVEFTEDDLIAGLKSIDVVPAKWVTVDEKENTALALFPPPPYDEEFNKIVKNCQDFSPYWEAFPIRIRGRANQLLNRCPENFLEDEPSYSNYNYFQSQPIPQDVSLQPNEFSQDHQLTPMNAYSELGSDRQALTPKTGKLKGKLRQIIRDQICRSCIILHLATKNHCPKCEVEINNSKPHLSLKPDKTLQDIVYKLVPGLFHAEMKRRNRFYLDKPDRDTHLHPEFRGISVDRLVYSPHDTICLSLEYYDNTKEKEDWENVGAHRSSIKPVTCSEDKMVQEIKDDDHSLGKSIKHFKCPAAVRIMHLKKLIQLKYNVDTKHKVELFHRRESLPDDYSLMDIAYIYAWKRNSPLKLYYRISLPEDHSDVLQRRLLLDSMLEDKSSHLAVVSIKDETDEKKLGPSNDFWPIKSPLKLIKPKAEPGCSPSSVVSDANQILGLKTAAKEDVSLVSTLAMELNSQEMTKCSESHSSKVSSVSTTIAATLPSSKPKVSLTTTAVHVAPKVSSKLKYYGDSKKQPKPVKTPVPNSNQMTSEKPSSNAIRSYLTISSIFNEPEPKKSPLAKVARSGAVVKECSNDLKTLPASTESPLPIIKLTVLSNESVEPKVVSPIISHSASSSSVLPVVTSPSVSSNEPKNSKSVLPSLNPLPTGISTNLTVAANSALIASTTAETATTLPIPASTSMLTPNNIGSSLKSVPGCTVLTNTKSSVSSATNMTTTNISSITTASGIVPCSAPVGKVPQENTTESAASIIMKKMSTSSTLSSAEVKISTSVAVPSPVSSVPPPLLTLKPSPASKISMPLLKPRPAQPSFILANTKIPSSLEISLTQSKNDKVASNSSVLSLQKMVTQNFATSEVNTMPKCAIKRPFMDVDETPAVSISKASSTVDDKKKLGVHEITLTTNDSVPAKKIFSPNILPEVSITLNPHPDQPTKRITPETSFDVTCFKPEPATNGIPPLTPIAKYSAGANTICKNIQNSPIKNLKTKSLKNPQRNSFSPKNCPRPLLMNGVEPKMRKINGAGNEMAKEAIKNDCNMMGARVNGTASPIKSMETVPILCQPQIDVKPIAEKKLTCAATYGSSIVKKDGARHQNMPSLIDINTPRYTQLMAAAAAAQNAKMRSAQYPANNLNSTLHIKLPSVDESAAGATSAALDLSSPSSSDTGCSMAPTVEKLFESPPNKKKLIQSMPQLMIPVSMSSRPDSKISPSGQSLTKIERRVSPIAKILDRKSEVPITPVKRSPTGISMGGHRIGGSASDLISHSSSFPTNGHSSPSTRISPSSKTSKTPPSKADGRHMSPSNGASLLSPVCGSKSPLAPSPTFMSMPGAANYATVYHMMQEQMQQQLQHNWLSKVLDKVPPHPLMFDHSKPSTSQESSVNSKK